MDDDVELDLLALSQQAAPFGICKDRQDSTELFDIENSLRVNALQDLDTFQDTSIFMQPPTFQASCKSPLKRSSPNSSPHPPVDKTTFDSVYFPAPQASLPANSPVKKLNYAPHYHPIAAKPQMALFTTFATGPAAGKENIANAASYGQGQHQRIDGQLGNHTTLHKRNPASLGQRLENSAQKQGVAESEAPLPEPQDMPSVPDDENGQKPPYSYANMIGMAILRAPNRRLTLSQIYEWIRDHFAYYRGVSEVGWGNSIRHNLSLNKAFIQINKSKEVPGKGNYWSIVPERQRDFYKEKTTRKPANAEVAYFQALPPDLMRPSATPALGSFPLPRKVARTTDSSKFPAEHEISSDGTIPASDPPAPVEKSDDAMAMSHKRSTSAMRSSPPGVEINSSPPVSRMAPPRGLTPLRDARLPSTSRSGGRQKHVDNCRDSGYFSSIGSSAVRGINNTHLSSESGRQRPVKKNGRAEEEIRRIRHSSIDPSPSKDRAPSIKISHGLPLSSSSPMNYSLDTGFPPLTPGVTLKPRAPPPPTISPNTHLHRHRAAVRDMIGTPANGPSPLQDETNWSPEFTIAEENASSPLQSLESPTKPYLIDADDILSSPTGSPSKPILGGELSPTKFPGVDFAALFDTPPTDGGEGMDLLFFEGSPLAKKTPITNSKRPNMPSRSTATANILADITSGNRKTRLASPIHIAPPKQSSIERGSPMKKRKRSPTPSLIDIWCEGDTTCSGSSSGDEMGKGMDLTKGFQGIGVGMGEAAHDKENMGQMGPPPKKMAKTTAGRGPRPALGRNVANVR
ncbi:MAG: hypothetical protein M1828_005203 [Chrysothrix sp. TS-e1954]|nr:MAG: hypothetical protein M1828_005203 [Chrysothrix sp. TS-e1954]